MIGSAAVMGKNQAMSKGGDTRPTFLAVLTAVGCTASEVLAAGRAVSIIARRAWAGIRRLFVAPANPCHFAFLCAAITLGILGSAYAETWKTAAVRQTDSVPILVDADYMVVKNDLVEIRAKYKQEKNLFTLLLPAPDVEERYVFNCDAKKAGITFRKVTTNGKSTVEFDAVPSAIVLTDIPQGSILQMVASWACSEAKNMASAQAAPPSGTAPTAGTGTKPQPRIETNWAWVGASVSNQETYWIDIDSFTAEKGVASFWVRENLDSPRSVGGITYASSMARYSTTCTNQQLSSVGATYYDSQGRVVGATPDARAVPSVADAAPGTVGRGIYDAACAYARGGDVARSQIFPQGIFDSSVEAREIPAASTSEVKFYIDVKSAYRDEKKGMAAAKLAAVRLVPASNPRSDDTKYYFELRLFACSQPHQSAYITTESFDPFLRMVASEYKAAADVKLDPVAPGSTLEAILTAACTVSLAAAGTTAAPEASKGKGESIGVGTAWYADTGYVVTAFHVVEGKKRILLYGVDRKPVVATMVTADPANDIAVLEASFPAKPTVGLPIAKIPAALGGRVFTIGFPHPDLLGISPKFTAGEVSAITGIGDDPRVLQISVPVQAGNSGGPLVNTAGEVVGIISGKLSADKVLKATGDLTQNVNYAVKARYLQGMLDDLGNRGPKASRPKPGPIEDIVTQVKGAIFLVVVE